MKVKKIMTKEVREQKSREDDCHILRLLFCALLQETPHSEPEGVDEAVLVLQGSVLLLTTREGRCNPLVGTQSVKRRNERECGRVIPHLVTSSCGCERNSETRNVDSTWPERREGGTPRGMPLPCRAKRPTREETGS